MCVYRNTTPAWLMPSLRSHPAAVLLPLYPSKQQPPLPFPTTPDILDSLYCRLNSITSS